MLKYLKKCVFSINHQTIKNFKILVVDNGSNDGTDDWLKRKKNKNLSIIKLNHNIGLAAARNIALESIDTEYFTFVDADDILRKKCLEYFWKIAQKEHAQVVTCNVLAWGEKTLSFHLHHPPKWYKNRHKAKTIFDYPEQLYEMAAWAKFYRTSYVKNLNCHFIEKSLFCEDIPFNSLVFFNATRLSVINKALYIYRLRGNSLSHSFGIHQIDDFIFSMKVQDSLIMQDSIVNFDVLKCIYETRFLLANLLLSRLDLNSVPYYFENMHKVFSRKYAYYLSNLFKELIYGSLLFEAIINKDVKQYELVKLFYI